MSFNSSQGLLTRILILVVLAQPNSVLTWAYIFYYSLTFRPYLIILTFKLPYSGVDIKFNYLVNEGVLSIRSARFANSIYYRLHENFLCN